MTTAIHRRVDALRNGEDPTCISRLASGWAVMGDPQLLPGYCLLLPDPVVGHLNELQGAARSRFLADVASLPRIATPTQIRSHGNSPPNRPFATEAINVACGASSGSGCSAVGTPMP